MGKRIRDTKGRFTTFWKNRMVTPLSWLGLFILLGVSYFLGTLGLPKLQVAEAKESSPMTRIVKIKEVTPILTRIAKCESGGKHYDKNGQVLVRGNAGSRESVDVGKYQINAMYWGKKSKELGLDITKEKDNEKMAMWIYENQGTGPWSSSAKCWSK